MKKLFIFSFAILIIITLCSCGKNTNTEAENEVNVEYLKIILEINNDSYENEVFNHKNVISSIPKITTDNSVAKEKILKINNEEKAMEYSDTLYYPVGEKKVYRYYVNGDPKSTVLIDQDGKVNSILYDFAYLEISNTSSPDEVIPLLEKELNKWFDISYYKYVNIPEISSKEEGDFGIYDFLYYNMVDGYITDYVKVSVSSNGSIVSFSINNLSLDCSNVNVDKELENKILNLKLQDIYDSDFCKYLSFEEVFPSQIVVYNGNLYAQYYVSAQCRSIQTGEEVSSYINTILIPVDVLRKN